jgi:hypothetical protein
MRANLFGMESRCGEGVRSRDAQVVWNMSIIQDIAILVLLAIMSTMAIVWCLQMFRTDDSKHKRTRIARKNVRRIKRQRGGL